MAISPTFGFPNVPRSITNPSVNSVDAIDNTYPMSFLKFIKMITVSFDPETMQLYYNWYIQRWNVQNNSSENDSKNIIVERYRDFLSNVIIQYSTFEEKTFLTKADLNDPLDLDIVMGFYSKKLTDLCSYYNSKRNNIKFNTTRNKIAGSNVGIEKNIYELTLSYLESLEDSKIILDFDKILENFDIEIEELYNTYPSHYNQLPDERVYDNKDIDYGLNIFLKDDQTLISEVFSNFSDTLKTIKETDLLFETKRNLTQKYVSTDFYYLSTGSTVTDYISGKLFSNTSGIENFFNREYPTTASTPREEYTNTPREMGFFTPSKTSILTVDGLQKSFSFNFDAMSPNSLYYFPDPTLVGTDTGIITYIVDDSFLKKNFTSGNANGQPVSSKNDTKTYGYVSKISPNQTPFLESIYNFGHILDLKKDIYSNIYGLFGNTPYIPSTVVPPIVTDVTSLIFNGYEFYDDMFDEGYAFNYATINNNSRVIRTGLSINGGTFPSYPLSAFRLSLGAFGYYKNIYGIKTFIESPQPTGVEEHFDSHPNYIPYFEISNSVVTIFDGAFITNSDMTLYPDPVSSDLSAFEISSGSFYYTDLLEGGITNNSPINSRALKDPLYPSLSAKFIPYNRLDDNCITYDGGNFQSYNLPTPNEFGNFTDNPPTTEILPPPTYDGLSGVLMIKNSQTSQVLPLLESFPYLTIKFPYPVIYELSFDISKFEIFSDIMIIETSNYLTITKVMYKDSKFIDPNSVNVYITHSEDKYSKLSNRYTLDNIIYYCKTNKLSSTNNNDCIIYPTIYAYNTIDNTNKVIYPPDLNISNFFNISSNTQYIEVVTPILSYSSRNDTFNIAFIMKDQNKMYRLHSLDFYISPDPIFINNTVYNNDIYHITNVFNNVIPSNISVYALSTIPTYANNATIII